MKPLNKQEQKVYDYIKSHPRSTTRDIQHDTWVTCPSGRITEMKQKGVDIRSVGKRHYEGSRAFEEYQIFEETKQLTWV